MREAVFRELRGDYVENTGQVVTPAGYLDYLEPLGSALSRQPEGVGGPFVYQFRGSGGRVVGAMGWVVSAAAKRYGGWKLWGVWTDGAIPALALPLCWPDLADPERLPELLRRANEDGEALLQRSASPELLDRVDATRLHDDDFRTALKTELTRLYRAPQSPDRPLEIDLPPSLLDLLPWVYLLGPTEPGVAQLQPSRFNGAGYQYILTEAAPAATDIPNEIHNIVDTTASDVLQGFRMAAALRERRARPRRQPAGLPSKPPASPPKKRPPESPDMRNEQSPQPAPRAKSGAARPLAPSSPELATLLRAVRDVVVIALLAWIGWEVHQLRKALTSAAAPPAAVTSTQADEPYPAPEPEAPPPTREQRLADALAATPPQGIRVDASAANDLPRAAVEIFLRRNNCFPRTEPVNGKFSTSEQRAIRTCTALSEQRLMRSGVEPHPERTLDWLEKTLDVR